MICDRCQGPTKPKQITSKKDGKQYTLHECTSGCMSGKYPYSMFPPREPRQTGPAAANASAGKMTGLLEMIHMDLLRIEKILANPQGRHIAKDELKPDEDIPF